MQILARDFWTSRFRMKVHPGSKSRLSMGMWLKSKSSSVSMERLKSTLLISGKHLSLNEIKESAV